jgi:hypothetical protein
MPDMEMNRDGETISQSIGFLPDKLARVKNERGWELALFPK